MPIVSIYPRDEHKGLPKDYYKNVRIIFVLIKLIERPSIEGWIHQLYYIYTMEYIPAIKRNESLIHKTTWMDLRNIIVSERSQKQKSTYCTIPCI